ncbi:MAG: hypothetical protein IPK19_29190 [Chloroflexi bacterium]|nr:hypothetical protein [Chloroflexota bacterium]
MAEQIQRNLTMENGILAELFGIIKPPARETDEAAVLRRKFMLKAVWYFDRVRKFADQAEISKGESARTRMIREAIGLLLIEWAQFRPIIDYLEHKPEDASERTQAIQDVIDQAKAKLKVPADLDIDVLPMIGVDFFMMRSWFLMAQPCCASRSMH